MMVKLRPARPSDAVALAAAERETAQTPGLLLARPNEVKVESVRRKILELRRAGRFLVAEGDGRMAGHAFLEPMGLEALAHIVRLSVVVHRGFRGRGIGRALAEGLQEWARRTRGIRKVELLVRATNAPAIALYRRLGFRTEGRLRKRARVGHGKLIDDLAMGWFP
jgi:ribosomal protein S18 acetylase RimI-like enzyme